MIRLHIIDDHSIIVDGIRQRLKHLQEEIIIAGSSDTTAHFIQSAPADSFDIIVLDLWLPGLEPLENLEAIRKHFPSKPVVIFTQETNAYWIRVMMEHGASAYVLKNAERREFKETLEKVYLGKVVVPAIAMNHKESEPGNPFSPWKYFLKPSERVIVVQLANGASLKDIATNRFSTVSAIEKTLQKIRAGFGVSTNPELIRVLMELKLI